MKFFIPKQKWFSDYNKLIILIICIFTLTLVAARISANNLKSIPQNQEVEFSFKNEIIKFLPFGELNKLLESNKKLVYMPYKELKKLIVEKSTPQKPAPVDYVIKDLRLNATVKEEFVAFDGDYKIELLNKKWVNIPLLSTNTGLKSAYLDETKVPVITNNSFFNIISDNVGEHDLKLKFGVKNTKVGNKSIAKFSIPDVAIATLEIKHPLNTTDLIIPNSTGLKTRVFQDYKITSANITGNGNIEISWKIIASVPKSVQKPLQMVEVSNKPSKVISNVNTLISIDEGLLQGFSEYSFRVYHSPVQQFTFEIPDSIEIIDISSPQNIINKSNYQISDLDKGKPGKLLTVYLNSKLRDEVNLNIAYEKTFENKKATLDIPNIYPVGKEINKVSGYLALQTSGNSEIKPVKLKNISRVDQSDLPKELENLAEYPIIAAYSFIKEDFSLVFEVFPHKDASVQVAMIDKAFGDSRLSSNGILTSKVNYTVRNMSEQFFKFNLPENAEILSAAINGIPKQVEKQESQDNKTITYLVNIKKNQNSSPFNLVIMYRQKFNTSIISKLYSYQNLNLPNVLNIPMLTLSWSIYMPDSMKYWNFSRLNKGEKNYSRYITSVNRHSYSSWVGTTNNMPSQVMSNSNVGEIKHMDDEGKVAGILPPEFSMPPAKGLRKFNFSEYLTQPGFISVSMLGIPYFIYYVIALLLAFLVWTACGKIFICKFVENKGFKESIKALIPELIGILVIGILLKPFIFWLMTILTAVIHIVLTKKNKKEK